MIRNIPPGTAKTLLTAGRWGCILYLAWYWLLPGSHSPSSALCMISAITFLVWAVVPVSFSLSGRVPHLLTLLFVIFCVNNVDLPSSLTAYSETYRSSWGRVRNVESSAVMLGFVGLYLNACAHGIPFTQALRRMWNKEKLPENKQPSEEFSPRDIPLGLSILLLLPFLLFLAALLLACFISLWTAP